MTVSKLTNEDSLAQWREAKRIADETSFGIGKPGLQGALGCVGEPLYEALQLVLRDIREDKACDHEVRLIKAAIASRKALAEMLQEHAQEQVEDAINQLVTFAECYQVDGCALEIQATDDLETIAQRGADELAYTISDWTHHVPEVNGEEL